MEWNSRLLYPQILGQDFRQVAARMVCLSSMMFGISTWELEGCEGSNHLQHCWFICLAFDSGYWWEEELKSSLKKPLCMVSPHGLIWASTEHGDQDPRVSVSRRKLDVSCIFLWHSLRNHVTPSLPYSVFVGAVIALPMFKRGEHRTYLSVGGVSLTL